MLAVISYGTALNMWYFLYYATVEEAGVLLFITINIVVVPFIYLHKLLKNRNENRSMFTPLRAQQAAPYGQTR